MSSSLLDEFTIAKVECGFDNGAEYHLGRCMSDKLGVGGWLRVRKYLMDEMISLIFDTMTISGE